MTAGARRLPDAAHEYDARLQHALRTVKVGAWYMDLINGARVWSKEVATLLGLPRDAVLDHRRMMEAVHPEDRERIRSIAQRALAEGASFQSDCRVVWPDGSVHWVSLKGCVRLNKAGAPYCIEGVVEDIEERKRLEADTRRAEEERKRLEVRLRQAQKMEALGTLAGGIAHDFNNVLAAIRGNASLAITDLPPDSPALTSIVEIKRSAARAADLVRQILAFSRQEEAKRRPLSLELAVAEALRLLRASLPARIEIRSHYQHDLPNVLADPMQVHQIIMNLGVNAAQSIGARAGLIDVQLDLAMVEDDGVRRTATLRPGYYVRLRVTDDGCGMDEATAERAYDPFFTTRPAGQGAGLGLSVVHGIMQAHEGAVSIESTPGKGTTFCLCFPIAPDAAGAGPVAVEPAPHGRGEHILYVDDEDALVFLAERALQRLGYRVTGHVDPSRALEAFRARPADFDFVVTDLSMPGMSGHDLAHELMQIRPDIPIVLTSGYVRPEDAQAARRLGIRDVVLKPNSIDDLARVVDAALVARRAGQGSG